MPEQKLPKFVVCKARSSTRIFQKPFPYDVGLAPILLKNSPVELAQLH
jgi:hypothetical protein